jgi:long-chain acyl-CoA synthetase
METVHQYLFESARRHADRTALIYDGSELRYAQMAERIRAIGDLLSDAGLRKGDRVAILLADKRRFILSVFAAMSRGLVAVPIPQGTTAAVVESVLLDCEPAALVTSAQDLSDLPASLHQQIRCRLLVDLDPPFALPARTELPLDGDDLALILYTSGTTGPRKGVLLTHRNLVQSTLNTNAFMRVNEGIRELVALPLAHSFGFGRTRSVLFAGGTLVLTSGPLNPLAIIQAALLHHCNGLSAVPAGIAQMMRLEALMRRIGPQMRFVELGSSPMPADRKRRLAEIFPWARICMHYGLTEASRSTFLDFRADRDRLETVGRAAPSVEIAVRDERGGVVAAGSSGEISIRGPHVARGYWKDPALSRARFTEDGWFRTGDFGFLDNDGYLYLLGRRDDVINVGGHKVTPLEVESAIREIHPDVDVCVVGVPDPAGIQGEVPVLCYVSNAGRTLEVDELAHALSGRLHDDHLPRAVYRLDRLPRSDGDKVLRRELRKLLIGEGLLEAAI